jgi:hypothetical protein
MHQYKVHLPKMSNYDYDGIEDWFDQSYTEGVNRDFHYTNDEDIKTPSSLDEIPIDIGGSFND